jgi:hypothetical protein
MFEKGTTLLPNKKPILIEEVQQELNKVVAMINERGLLGGSVEGLKTNKARLEALLLDLRNAKGVITGAKVDDVLDALDEAKKSRLQTEFYFGIKKSTLYLITFVALGVGAYFYMKNRKK